METSLITAGSGTSGFQVPQLMFVDTPSYILAPVDQATDPKLWSMGKGGDCRGAQSYRYDGATLLIYLLYVGTLQIYRNMIWVIR